MKRRTTHQLSVRMVGRHSKDCYAIRNEREGKWDTCWGPLAFGDYGAPIVKTRRRYGKNGNRFTDWLRFVCNCCECKAELHVDADFVLKMAGPINSIRQSALIARRTGRKG